ncbi:hypothetical protein CDAR_277601 [Caerostris darwini]|uniref:Uncharacterized protein n=1 Tax=Caerostris darwini TaxID=1538125 RepID=A0AAV4PCE4_9ARAC|nr:hypothetical protein CDAR_277601 [Caerostris darwini]
MLVTRLLLSITSKSSIAVIDNQNCKYFSFRNKINSIQNPFSKNIPSILNPLKNKNNLNTRQQATHHNVRESLKTTSPDIRIESSAITSHLRIISKEHSIHLEDLRQLEESQYKARHSVHESLETTSPDIRTESSATMSDVCAKTGTIARCIYVIFSILGPGCRVVTGFKWGI